MKLKTKEKIPFMVGGVLPESKFRCSICGAEWDYRRGNKIIHAGDLCNVTKMGWSMDEYKRPTFCKGILLSIKR